MKKAFISLVIIEGLIIPILTKNLIELKLQQSTIQNDINVLVNSQITSLSLKEEYPTVKDIKVLDANKNSKSLSTLISGKTTNLIVIRLTDCRLCFDELFKKLSKNESSDIPKLIVLFISDDFNDFRYFNEINQRDNTTIVWSQEGFLFGSYYDLGVPLILNLDRSLKIKKLSYLSFKYPSIGLSYFK